MEKEYKIIIIYEPTVPYEERYVAYSPELGRGTSYCLGKTRVEALLKCEKEISELIKFANEHNLHLPSPLGENDEISR